MTTSIRSLNDDKTLIVMMPPPCVDGSGLDDLELHIDRVRNRGFFPNFSAAHV
jgi:hypothetical protein